MSDSSKRKFEQEETPRKKVKTEKVKTSGSDNLKGQDESTVNVEDEHSSKEEDPNATREWPGPQIKIRDQVPKQEEEQGTLKFITISNEPSKTNLEHLRLLVELKSIISKQLPNMPKIYITRLVLDPGHKSLVGIKDGSVIGGITFKCMEKEGMTHFVEVVFCAITANQQVRGYGSRLMNHLKAWAQKNRFYHLLTYADDYAIGYFQRQGFTLEIELDRKDWDIGFLKHYDSATLMHCKIDKTVDYLEVTAHLRIQRLAFVDKMKELTNQHIIYPGVKDFQKGAVRIDLENLRGLKEAGWEPDQYKQLLSPERQKDIYEQNLSLLTRIKEDPSDITWPFKAPVQELYPQDAEKYLQEVMDPIDLRTIEDKLKKGFYITHEMLLADLQRMVDNAKSFNHKGSIFYELAEKINTLYLNHKIEVPVMVENNDN